MEGVKPFRALRYDAATAGPLDELVAPPYDVITADARDRLLAASPYNCVRLIRPDDPDGAAETFREWRERAILVREQRPAVWFLEDEFVGPDGVRRTRRALVARIRLRPYSAGIVLPHERTFAGAKEARLRLLRAARAKLSPIFLLHRGRTPEVVEPGRSPDLEATLGGATTRAWRIEDPGAIASATAGIRGSLLIADGHHRYETALRFHEEEGGEETAYVLAALVSSDDPGLVVYPTHRLVRGELPDVDGGFSVTPLSGAADAAGELARVSHDRPAFVLLARDHVLLAEAEAVGSGPLSRLDTAAIERLALEDVGFTASVAEAERAVATGEAAAALLVRPPTIEQIEAVARSGERMPPKSTYFFPKLTSGLLFSPFDE